MAIGDAAVTAGMDVVSGTVPANTLDTEINKTRDYIAERTNAVQPVAKGGTGGTTPDAAVQNLGAVKSTSSPTHHVGIGWTGARNRMTVNGTSVGDIATTDDLAGKASTVHQHYTSEVIDLDAQLGNRVAKTGDTMSGHLFLPNATAATSSYTAAYINGDGRVSRGASARKYKKYISAVDPLSLGDIFPQLVRYQMRGGDGDWKLGHIADDLEGTDAARFAVHIDGEVESIDFIQLLLAQTAYLHAALDLVLDRLERLESGE